MQLDNDSAAKATCDAFYERLRQMLGRYRPRDYAPVIASMVIDSQADIKQMARYPIHFLIHSIEANCAYHKLHKANSLSRGNINDIFNHYKGYRDPYVKHVLETERSIELFAAAVGRQQFDLQRREDMSLFYRGINLFINDRFGSFDERLKKHHGFSISEWLFLCYSVYVAALDKRPPMFHANLLRNAEIKTFPRHAVDSFLKVVSRTPQQAKELFIKRRRSIDAKLHIFIRSIFFDYPLLSFDEQILMVHPGLMSYAALDGIYRLFKEMDSEKFGAEFGKSFASCVERLLASFVGDFQLLTERDILKHSSGKSCDFVLDFPDEILLIECKATKYSSHLATRNAMENDNSTKKVADGFEQLVATASRIRRGEFGAIIPNGNKPISGIVITFGEIPFVNGSAYINDYVRPRMSGATQVEAGWYSPMAQIPQVLSIELLEHFICVQRIEQTSPTKLLDEKAQIDAHRHEDWDVFLNARNACPPTDLAAVKDAADRFNSILAGH